MERSLINRQIDDFVIQEHMGYNALSVLFRATQVSLNRDVTLKILGLEAMPLERSEFLRDFMEQAGIVTQIEHLHVLPIYAYGVYNDEFAYLATRLMPSKLAELLYERPISLNRCSQILSQVAAGLDDAFSKGVLHGSISPGNIYLDQTQNAFIDDYEMSAVAQAAQTPEQLLRILGNPVYASPEQLHLQPITHHSDIYSLGTILYRMTTGRAPFEMLSGSIHELMQMHDQNALVPPRKLNPDIPAAAEAVILKALHENPTERFETAIALAQAFDAAIQRDAVSISSGKSSDPPTVSPSSERSGFLRVPVWLIVLAALVIVVLVVGLLLISGG